LTFGLPLQGLGGAACLAIGLYLIWLGGLKLLQWPRATGVVLTVLRIGGVPTPEIEFADAAGVKHVFFARLPYRQMLKVGDKVKVLYDPKEPAQAERINLMGLIGGPLMFALFGLSQAWCGFLGCK